MSQKLEWKDSYSIAIDEIDAQHKKLLAIANELYDLSTGNADNYKNEVSKALKKLTDYTEYHFSYEESFEEKDTILDLKNVLVVDDNEKNRIILKQMLSFKDIETDLAANGFEAIQFLMKGNRYDAILMDYHMPVLSGLETIEKIKALFS